MRHLDVSCEVDFMAVASYGSRTESSGVVRILKDLDAPLEGRHVLIVEDIVDSGLTLQYLLRTLEARGPASLEVCALLTKPSRRTVDLPVRYTGFEIPDKFAIGYGLDYAERYREPAVRRDAGRSPTTDSDASISRAIGSRTTLRKPAWTRDPPGSLDSLDSPYHLRALDARRFMSRFFKSAAFPILIVIVLAFFASKLIQSGNEAPRDDLQPVPRADRRRRTSRTSSLRTKDYSAEVTLKGADPKKYTVGLRSRANPATALINKLRAGAVGSARSTTSTSSRRARTSCSRC